MIFFLYTLILYTDLLVKIFSDPKYVSVDPFLIFHYDCHLNTVYGLLSPPHSSFCTIISVVHYL